MKKAKPDTGGPGAEEYNRILKGLKLEDLFLVECSAKVQKEKLKPGPLHVSIKDEKTHKLESEHSTHVQHKYELTAWTESRKDVLVKLSCSFRLVYSSKEILTPAFMGLFVERNVPWNTWPYFRELVQSMTQRMNIPPLVLPLLT